MRGHVPVDRVRKAVIWAQARQGRELHGSMDGYPSPEKDALIIGPRN